MLASSGASACSFTVISPPTILTSPCLKLERCRVWPVLLLADRKNVEIHITLAHSSSRTTVQTVCKFLSTFFHISLRIRG